MKLTRTTRPSGRGVIRTKMMCKDESGALNYLMIAMIVIIAILALALVMGSFMQVIALVLIVTGLMFIVQTIPMIKGLYGVVAGLILCAAGAWIWLV